MILRKFNDSEYEPHLQEFLKEYYAAEFPYFSFKIIDIYIFCVIASSIFLTDFLYLALFYVHSALRAPPAVTRLTVHRRIQLPGTFQKCF